MVVVGEKVINCSGLERLEGGASSSGLAKPPASPAGARWPGRGCRPTGEGVKNLDNPSMSPLVFLFMVGVARVEVGGVRGEVVMVVVGEEEEGLEVANRGASPVLQGSAATSSACRPFVRDAA